MLTIMRDILQSLHINSLPMISSGRNNDLMNYFVSEYKGNARAAYDYFRSTGQMNYL